MATSKTRNKKRKPPTLEIEQSVFSALHAKLRSYDHAWAEKLAARCNQAIKENPEYAGEAVEVVNSIYNVFNGVVRNPARRRFVLKMATEQIKATEDEVRKIKELAISATS